MLRVLTAWLVPTTKEDPIAPGCCKSYGDVAASRRFIFHHMPDGTEPISAPRKRRSLDDGPRPYPVHNSPTLTTARSISPPSDVSEEELEEAMAQFTEISFSALHPTPRDTTSNATQGLATTADEQNSKDKEEVLPPPKCWCRLPTNAKEARMRANDPLNPGRAYWTCANVGGACNFFQWAEASPATKRPPAASSSSSPILSRAKAAAVDDTDSSEPLSGSPPSPAGSASAPKPYRTSAPIPIPRASGGPANSRRRTPAKSAQDGQDSSC